VRVEVEESPSACLLDGRTVVVEVAVEDFHQPESRFEQRGRLVDGVEQLLSVGLGKDGDNQDFVLLGGTVGVGLEGLEDGDVAPEVFLVPVLLDEFLEFCDALLRQWVTISRVSAI
jgi:hypothetical protein